MEIWTNLAAWCSQYLFTIQLTDILDVAIIAYLVYRLLGLVRSTNSERIFKGVLFVLIALGLSDYFELKGLFFIFNMLMEWGVLALIILFQPEIRRILEQVGGSRFSFLKIFSKEQQLGGEAQRPREQKGLQPVQAPGRERRGGRPGDGDDALRRADGGDGGGGIG